MGSYAPDETVAQVRALALQGLPATRIADSLNLPHRTAQRWIQEWRELASEQHSEIADQERRINVRLGAIVEQRLDAIQDGREQVTFRDLMVSLGIGRSKEHERAQRSQPQGGVQVNIQIVAPAVQDVAPSSLHVSGNGVNHDAPSIKGVVLDTEAD